MPVKKETKDVVKTKKKFAEKPKVKKDKAVPAPAAKRKAEKEITPPAETKAAARQTRKREPPTPKERISLTRGKRKEAIARATVRKGKGVVRINKFGLETLRQPYMKAMIEEPLLMAGAAAKELDIEVSVCGGGPMGQAEAIRQAIARGIVDYTGDQELKAKMLKIDRHLLSEDSRRVEPKKYKGPKARARFQKSYR